MSSPWGAIQTSRTYAPGVRFVTTAGHGGYMVASTWAEKHLSEDAREGALRHGGYYCYEEDCDWAIVEYESAAVREAAREDHNHGRRTRGKYEWSVADYLNLIQHSLANWNPAYWRARQEAA